MFATFNAQDWSLTSCNANQVLNTYFRMLIYFLSFM